MTKLSNIQREAKQIQLSAQEKAFLRARIFGEPAPTPSYMVSNYHFFSVRFAPLMAALLIMMLGGGTAYAAQAAIPGDLLYSVKVGVNERVADALAVSTESKVALHADLVKTRLKEAEALAAEGRLTAETSEQIETGLDTHLAYVEEFTSKLEEEQKEEVGVEVSAALESALSTHGFILAALGESSEDEDTKEEGLALANRITARAFARVDGGMARTMAAKAGADAGRESATFMVEEMNDISQNTMATMTMEASAEIQESDEEDKKQAMRDERAAASFEVKAQAEINDGLEVFEEIKSSLDSTTTARVEAQFDRLNDQFEVAADLYEHEEFAASRAEFGVVLSDAAALHAYLDAEQRFNRKLLRSWLDNRFGQLVDVWVQVDRNEDRTHERDEDGREDGEEHDEDEATKGVEATTSVEVKVDLGL